MDASGAVLHWYDFICPFCSIAQQRNAVLARRGIEVVELPFRAHPEIPPDGIPAGPHVGPMYAALEREAADAGLPLRWPSRLPDTHRALAAAEWTRRSQPDAFPRLHRDLFAARFASGEDLGDPAVVDRRAREAGVDVAALHAALADGSADAAVAESEAFGRSLGVYGTPAWRAGGRLIMGLRPPAGFEDL